MKPSPSKRYASSIVLIAVIIAAALSLYGLFILNRSLVEKYHVSETFLNYWVGNRDLLEKGDSPYSLGVESEINQTYQSLSGQLPDPENQVVYPLYFGIPFLPFTLIQDPALAQSIWMLFLEIALILTVILNLRVSEWHISAWMLPLFVIFSAGWFFTVLPVLEGQAILLCGLLVALAFAAVRAGLDELAGLALALATITPFAVLFLIVFVVFWSAIQGHWRLFFWFFGSLLLLILGGMLFVPAWPVQFFQKVQVFTAGFTRLMPGAAFLSWWPGIGLRLGWFILAVLGLAMLIEWWLAWNLRNFEHFLWTGMLTLTIGQVAGLGASFDNLFILLLPVTLIFSGLSARWKSAGQAVVVVVMGILFAVPWWLVMPLSSLGLPAAARYAFQVGLSFLVIFGLYWVRWWFIRPKRLLINDLRDLESRPHFFR